VDAVGDLLENLRALLEIELADRTSCITLCMEDKEGHLLMACSIGPAQRMCPRCFYSRPILRTHALNLQGAIFLV
jgi:hypothetical protein